MKKSGCFFRLGFEAGALGIQSRSAAHPTVTFMKLQQKLQKKMSLIRD
jgi:hypothetical protein